MNRIVEFSPDQFSLRDLVTGEPMHSRIGPIEEAVSIYVEQCQLTERLLLSDPEPLILWDLGLGIAANSVAAIECRRALSKGRPLHLYSVERDLSGLRLALDHLGPFSYLKNFEGAARTLLDKELWISDDDSVVWRLVEGSFPEISCELPSPEVVFYDFYSPKTNPEAWQSASLEALYRACLPRKTLGKSTVLATYCAASHVRKGLEASGFAVERGRGTAAKRETTLAFT